MFARLKPYFKAKYFWSVFLVCGVLSISIGTPPQKDPLLVQGEALVDEFERIFCVSRRTDIAGDGKLNCGEKDPALLSEAELDGPDVYTLDEKDPGLVAFMPKLKAFGASITAQSDIRANMAFAESSPTLKAKAAIAAAGVIVASKLYVSLQQHLYANYLRLAHETPFMMYRRTSFGAKVMNVLTNPMNPAGAAKADFEKWKKKNAEALKALGAAAFKKNRYEDLNLQLNSRIAEEFFYNENHGMKYNIRHAKNKSNGAFDRIELFLNEEEKRLIEFSALGAPRSKDEYVKLLQFAAIRESLTNRWAMRRMVNYLEFDPTRVDKPINSCAPELVSFRMSKRNTIANEEMYTKEWQEDRYSDFIAKIEPISAATAYNQFYGPLLRPEGYADLVLLYLEQFPSFRTGILPSYAGREDELFAIIQNEQAYAPGIADLEHTAWSIINPKTGMSVQKEAFLTMNLPGDSLAPADVAERYTWKTYELRKTYLIEALTEMVAVMGLPEAKTNFAPKKAIETVNFFMSQCASLGGDLKLCSRENIYKGNLRAFLEVKVREEVYQDYAYLRDRAKARHEEFLSGLRPLAVKGALGFQVREAAESHLEQYRNRQKWGIGTTSVPSDSKYESDGKSSVKVKVTPRDHYLRRMAALKSDDITPYVDGIPYRQSWKRYALKQFVAPTTPDQVSSLFFKKLELMAKLKNSNSTGLAEEEIAVKLRENRPVMRGMEFVFGKIAEAYEDAAKAKHPEKNLPAAMQMAANSGKANAKKGDTNCQTVLINPKGKAADKAPKAAAETKKRKPAREDGPALDGAAMQEVCVKPPVDEELANAKILESVLVAGAKAGYEHFLKEMERAPQYKNPARAEKKIAANREWIRKKYESMPLPLPARDNTFVARPRLVAPLEPQKAAPTKVAQSVPSPIPSPVAKASSTSTPSVIEKSKFRPGKDQSLAMDENDAYVEPALREEAKKMIGEALAMIGLGEAVTGKVATFQSSAWFRPLRVNSWFATENLISRQLPAAGYLERMAGTLFDQVAMGQVLEQEAYARAPILAIQPTWKPSSEEDTKNFLARVAQFWTPAQGWDVPAFDRTFREVLLAAVRNDLDKTETYCRADIRNYQDDIDFRNMFNSASGLRAALSQMEGADKWDAEIQKEARSLKQIVLQDYIDPYGMYIFLGMMLIIAWQFAPLILNVMHVSTLAGAVQMIGAAVGKLTVSKLGWMMLTGNLAPVNIIFTSQTVLMISVYMYQLPVQIAHHFQVANSQVVKTSLPGYLLDRSFADREKMHEMREELASNQGFTKFAIVAEIGAFAGFTIPGVVKTMGFRGASKMAHLQKGIDPKILDNAKLPSFRDLMREHGTRKGLKMYMGRVTTAMKTMNRIPMVIPGAASRAALYEATAAQLANHFKSKDDFIRFLNRAKQGVEEDAKFALGIANESTSEVRSLARKRLAEEISTMELQKNPNQHVKGFFARLDEAAPDDYITVVFDRRFRKWKTARQDRSLAAQEAEAIKQMGEAEKLLREVDKLDDMIRRVNSAPIEPGTPELKGFFKGMVQEGEIEDLRTYYMKHRKEMFDKNTRDEVIKTWRALDYLKEDWEKLTKYVIDKPRRAATFIRTSGRADLYIDADGGIPAVIPKIAADANAEDLDTYTIRRSRFREGKTNKPVTRDRAPNQKAKIEGQ